MKKALALILSLLVAFSMFTVATFAEGEATPAEEELVNIVFKDSDGKVIKTINVAPGTKMTPYVPANPEKADTETTRYTFAGWKSSVDTDEEPYAKNTVPDARVDVVYTATYTEKDISQNQTFWNFIESIFARINLLFQYFAEIFRFDGGSQQG